MVKINDKSFRAFRFFFLCPSLSEKKKGRGIKGKLCFHPLHTISTCSIVKPWRSLGCLDPCSSLLVCCFRFWLTPSFVTHVALTAKAPDILDCIHVSQGQPSSLALVYTTEHLGRSKPLSALLIETFHEVFNRWWWKDKCFPYFNPNGHEFTCTSKQGLRQEECTITEADLYTYLTLSRSTWTKMRRVKLYPDPLKTMGQMRLRPYPEFQTNLTRMLFSSTWICSRPMSYPDPPVPTWVELTYLHQPEWNYNPIHIHCCKPEKNRTQSRVAAANLSRDKTLPRPTRPKKP